MKVVSINHAAPQLGKLFADALNGESVILNNGVSEVTLTPGMPNELAEEFDLDKLEALLLEGLEGESRPYSHAEMHEECMAELKKRKGA